MLQKHNTSANFEIDNKLENASFFCFSVLWFDKCYHEDARGLLMVSFLNEWRSEFGATQPTLGESADDVVNNIRVMLQKDQLLHTSLWIWSNLRNFEIDYNLLYGEFDDQMNLKFVRDNEVRRICFAGLIWLQFGSNLKTKWRIQWARISKSTPNSGMSVSSVSQFFDSISGEMKTRNDLLDRMALRIWNNTTNARRRG